LKQPKQKDLFQNEPKQTKNVLKNIKSTKKNTLFPAAVSNNKKQKMAPKLKKKTKKCSPVSLDQVGLNFNAINLKF